MSSFLPDDLVGEGKEDGHGLCGQHTGRAGLRGHAVAGADFCLRLHASPRDFGWSTSLDRGAPGPLEHVFLEPNWPRAKPRSRLGKVNSRGIARRCPLAHPKKLTHLGQPGKFQCHG
jgi:hypothetical protein